MQALELKVLPVAVIVVFGIAMWAASTVLVGASFFLPGAAIIAFISALIGAVIALSGVASFRQHDTTVNPTRPETTTLIVTAGIYRFTRNPMYLGLAFVLAGWAVYLANIAAMALVPVFALYMTRFQIKPEERALMAKFGADFADYMATVRRWL